jgi:inorganic pyrophosphatase
MHPWHDISPGPNTPEVVDCIVEIPMRGHNKYELDKETGLLRLDRVLFSAVYYPANYGFIPQTYHADDDPLDVLILGREPVDPLCIVSARPIGVMQLIDTEEEDDKIIAVHCGDPVYESIHEVDQLPRHILEELQRFFEEYKVLERKAVFMEGWLPRDDAYRIITESCDLYKEKFGDRGKAEG